MKERPIIFSCQDVRAILDGRKTQTRRVMKPQPSLGFLARGIVDVVPQYPLQNGVRFFMRDGMSELVSCPYGQPVDRLWVRETLELDCDLGWVYQSGGDSVPVDADEAVEWCISRPALRTVVPSIHMPRWASRITLEITGVRVERLQDISEADAKAEGVEAVPHTAGEWMSDDVVATTRVGKHKVTFDTYRTAFARLWNSINGDGAWDSNPFVWVISFKRVGNGGAR